MTTAGKPRRMNPAAPLVLFGAGPLARLLRLQIADGGGTVAAFTVDREYCDRDSFDGLPLVPWQDFLDDHRFADCDMLAAVGYRSMKLRQQIAQRIAAAGRSLGRFVSPAATTASHSVVGEGTVIFPGVVVEPGVRIGTNNLLWSGTILCHDSQVGDHNYFSPRSTVAGNCHIGDRCFFGVGASLIDGVTVGDDCHIQPGSMLYAAAEPCGVYGGSPATRRREVDASAGVGISR